MSITPEQLTAMAKAARELATDGVLDDPDNDTLLIAIAEHAELVYGCKPIRLEWMTEHQIGAVCAVFDSIVDA